MEGAAGVLWSNLALNIPGRCRENLDQRTWHANHCKMASMAPPPLPPFVPGWMITLSHSPRCFFSSWLHSHHIPAVMEIFDPGLLRTQVDASDPVAPVPVDPERLQKLRKCSRHCRFCRRRNASDIALTVAICWWTIVATTAPRRCYKCGHVFHATSSEVDVPSSMFKRRLDGATACIRDLVDAPYTHFGISKKPLDSHLRSAHSANTSFSPVM